MFHLVNGAAQVFGIMLSGLGFKLELVVGAVFTELSGG